MHLLQVFDYQDSDARNKIHPSQTTQFTKNRNYPNEILNKNCNIFLQKNEFQNQRN